ncbi:MAG: hypothetical protein PUC96_03335 [Bacteroidales bacterium]|nr:hypothetical protein [Bacteroidales bacterium]
MSSRAVAPQPEYMVSGCYGHSCGELWRALLAVAVARLGTSLRAVLTGQAFEQITSHAVFG